MTQETLLKIHQEYMDAALRGKNTLNITELLYERLCALTIPEEDSGEFDAFLTGLQSCLNHRKQSDELISLLVGVVTTIYHIISFMNHRGKNWETDIKARQKSLERDFSKILRKAIAHVNTCIRDRFGGCIILLNENDFDEKQQHNELLEISNAIQVILCNKNRQLKNEFLEFVSKISNPMIRQQIETTLGLTFWAEFFKDYVLNPKEDGYQSIHVCLRLDPASIYFSGAVIELQIRTKTMNENATTGEYNHRVYEEKTSKEVQGIFEIPENAFIHSNIIDCTSYKGGIYNIDGLSSAKFFFTPSA